ncbi:MAG: NAD(P)H-dependent oxidoreductase subunit E [Candidatus Marinimicrobia bacterium]|nr:NAD(P)H-dependent oxidoreductase subunit E [Candidatus Neomarinimicrobiota bacterium]
MKYLPYSLNFALWQITSTALSKNTAICKGTPSRSCRNCRKKRGACPKASLRYISEKTNIPAAELFGIATFYSMFRLKPQGRHLIRTCKGTACHVSGADTLATAIRTYLNLQETENTTDDGRFTLLEVACLGCCSLAPVVMIDDTTYGKLSAEKIIRILNTYD